MRILTAVLCGAVLAAQTAPEATVKLTVDGDVATPITLTAAELAKMPRDADAFGAGWI